MDELTKSIKLHGESLVAAMKYNDKLKTAVEEFNKAQQEASIKLTRLQAQHLNDLETEWKNLARYLFSTEDEVNKSWKNPHYRLDVTYLDTHGEAYFNIFNMGDSYKEFLKEVPTSGTVH